MSKSLKKLLDTFKYDSVVLGDIQRALLGQDEFDVDRRHDVIHPSELVRDDFCPRATYYRLAGWKIPPEDHGFQLEVIFAQGHGYHDKWQNWVWDIGKLRGQFRCLACGHGDWGLEEFESWYTTAPEACAACGATRKYLQYGEVPARLEKYGIVGLSDGDIDLDPDDDPMGVPSDPLLEIKSIGEGTVRVAAPALLAKHTKTVEIDGEERRWTDWNKVWRDIRRPFQAHVKQGAIYALARGRTSMVFIYEFKPTGAVKEFTVEFDFDVIERELDLCLDILWGLENDKPPPCVAPGDCKSCAAYEALNLGDGDGDGEAGGSEDRADPDAGAGEGAGRARRVVRAEEADERDAGTRRGVERDRGLARRRPDGRVRAVHSLGGLLERAGDAGRDHRGHRRSRASSGEGHRDAVDRREEGRGAPGEGRRRVVRRGDRG